LGQSKENKEILPTRKISSVLTKLNEIAKKEEFCGRESKKHTKNFYFL